jgi:hypothetical protein
MTIFSASNYAGCCTNLGAVLVIPPSGKLAVKEHKSKPLAEIRNADMVKRAAVRGLTLAPRSRKSLLAETYEATAHTVPSLPRHSVPFAH